MARVLIYTSPALGHLDPALGVAASLTALDQQVTVYCLTDQVDAVRAQGYWAEALDPRIEARIMDDFEAANPVAAVKRALTTFAERAPFEVDDLQRAIAASQPDVLLIDTNAFGARMAAEASGLPWVCFQPFLSPLPAPGVPPFGPGLKPLPGLIGRLRDAAIASVLTGTLARLTLNAVNPLRADLDLAPLPDYASFHTRPPKTLYFTSAEFDYPREQWPASFVMCGPVHRRCDDILPDWLRDESREIVLVSCSTERQRDRVLVDVTLQALADSDDLIVATTAAHDPSTFAPPANARIERFASHDLLLPRCAAVICHGGMGITQKALMHGVPLCVVPFGRDQLEVARRVEHAGAGVRLAPGQLKPGGLRSALLRARDCKAGATKMAAAFARAGGADRAAREIVQLVRGA